MAVHPSLDEAVMAAYDLQTDPESRVEAMRSALEAVVASDEIDYMAYSSRSKALYARYLLSDPSLPVQMVLAFWRPGAESPIHDHSGLTGAVVALSDGLVEEKYELEPRGERYQIADSSSWPMRKGVVSSIFPDGVSQVHKMTNLGGETAVSLHVYLGRLERLNRYFPDDDGLLRAEPRDLWFDGEC